MRFLLSRLSLSYARRHLAKTLLTLLGVVIFAAIFAPLLSAHDPYQQDLLARMKPPFWMEGSDLAHPLGTDFLGRDYLV